MSDEFSQTLLQVAIALVLGVFFGLERRLRGYPDAGLLHACLAGAGLLVMVLVRPKGQSLPTVMAAAMAISFLLVWGLRLFLQWLAEAPDLFAEAGADTFTLTGALSVGCACGAADGRAVMAVMLIMTVVSLFRPFETAGRPVLQGGESHALARPARDARPRDGDQPRATDAAEPPSRHDIR